MDPNFNNDLDARVYVAGHRGMVGSAIVRQLKQRGFTNILTRSSTELNLTRQQEVEAFFVESRPDYVFLAAAKVGGIHANNEYPADFIYDNLMIEGNIIRAAHENGIKRLLFLGSSCIYPKLAEQPMQEKALLTGPLEPTNEPYAIAKIAGIKLCESFNRQFACDFRSVMPTNLYGPGDNFHPENSHVIPALLRRFHEAKTEGLPEVAIWGSGNPKREFLYVDDMAEACLHVMAMPQDEYVAQTETMLSHVNVGTGTDVTIRELAETVAKVTGYEGNIVFDTSMPDGAPRKLMDVSLLGRLGWQARTELEPGLTSAYQWFLDHQQDIRQK
ncbi:MAG: GDP-fucose synthetase [Oleiphilus sp.]|nr:MAG: GDP-fucose synthetase [Oleiphilus sp.]